MRFGRSLILLQLPVQFPLFLLCIGRGMEGPIVFRFSHVLPPASQCVAAPLWSLFPGDGGGLASHGLHLKPLVAMGSIHGSVLQLRLIPGQMLEHSIHCPCAFTLLAEKSDGWGVSCAFDSVIL